MASALYVSSIYITAFDMRKQKSSSKERQYHAARGELCYADASVHGLYFSVGRDGEKLAAIGRR